MLNFFTFITAQELQLMINAQQTQGDKHRKVENNKDT